MRQDKALRYEAKVLSSVFLSHLGQVLVHVILFRHLCRLWIMVCFLVSAHALVQNRFDVAACPDYRPLLLRISHPSEPIVFKSVSNHFDVDIVVELKVQFLVRWLVWPDGHWIDVRTKQHVLL